MPCASYWREGNGGARMIDQAERDKIERDAHEKAELLGRVAKLEADMKEIESVKVWGFRAIGAGIIYMFAQAWDFIVSLPK
jgi:hypothetical protein